MSLAIPNYQNFMRPLLLLASKGDEQSIKGAISVLADQFNLSEEDRTQLLPSGFETVFANRVSWAKTYLSKAGALEKTKRAHFKITDRGLSLLRDYPNGVNSQILRKFPEFLAFQHRSNEQRDEPEPINQQPNDTLNQTPQEAIERAEKEIVSALKEELLSRIRDLSPTFFERLVVDLIVAMGYGGSRDYVVQAVGRSGDAGIDGIVNEDVLGLDRVYIQAKRYAPDKTISREQIQQFAGALVGHSANKGVFFTTSSFAKTAAEYAQKISQRIILIDGSELTRLMVQYNVGIRIERSIEMKRVDTDYFEEVTERD